MCSYEFLAGEERGGRNKLKLYLCGRDSSLCDRTYKAALVFVVHFSQYIAEHRRFGIQQSGAVCFRENKHHQHEKLWCESKVFRVLDVYFNAAMPKYQNNMPIILEVNK